MAGRTKKQKIASAIFVILFFSMVAFGVVTYTYDSFTTVETKPGQTTRVEDDDEENFLHKYMEAIYGRLQNGNR